MAISKKYLSFSRARLFLLLLFLMGADSCNNSQKKPEYLIGFSQCVGSDLWRQTMLQEMKMELSLYPNVKFIYADAENDSKTQINQVKKMVDDGIDLLIISPNEAKPLTGIVEQTYNKGIPVIVIDRKTSSSLYTAYVGADNYQIGKMAGEYLGSTLEGPSQVLEVMGLPGSSPAIERDRGFHDGLKKFSNIEITAQVYGDWLKSHAEAQLIKIPQQLKGINAVFAHNDMMASAAAEVFNKLKINHNVKFVGVDAQPGVSGGLKMVEDHVLDASLLYPTGGKEAITTALEILNKEPFPRDNILKTVVINSSNVQLMNLQWSRISNQQKDIERQQSLLAEQEDVYKNQQVILDIIVITLVLAVVFGGLAFYSLMENRKINKSLEVKNNEILEQRNLLIEMSDKAENAVEAKLNFFTNMSHEFRTPLTLILSPLEDLMGNEKIKMYAGRNLNLIHKNAIRLLRLVNQLIEYRKIEYHKVKVKASPNNIFQFVNDILESFQHNAKKRNIDLQLIGDKKDLIVWFDINMLDKVLFNLLSNAFKFTSDNGKVYVYIKQNENQVLIEVEDNGIGMSEETRTHLFELFFQENASAFKGSGLGLSLSKELILLHHGDITVKSQKWQGTTFSILLPLGSEHLKEDEILSTAPDTEPFYEKAKIFTTELDESEALESLNVFSPLKDQTLLIVEDNQDLLNYLTERFSSDYEVFTANNGLNGLNEAYERVPDLIISDVLLPGISGKELTSKLKSDIRTSHIPIILLTAKGSVEQQIDGIKSMADAYITKPFNLGLLEENVKSLLKSRLILKEHYTSEIPNEKIQVSKGLDKKFLNDLAGLVENNLSNENFSVDEISKTMGISRIQLYRKVKALMGCSITDYILSRRLKKAKYMLLNEDYTISEITYKVGFASATYFSTAFKSKYGYTPSEFKKQEKI